MPRPLHVELASKVTHLCSLSGRWRQKHKLMSITERNSKAPHQAVQIIRNAIRGQPLEEQSDSAVTTGLTVYSIYVCKGVHQSACRIWAWHTDDRDIVELSWAHSSSLVTGRGARWGHIILALEPDIDTRVRADVLLLLYTPPVGWTCWSCRCWS